jgi:hypothetical protein
MLAGDIASRKKENFKQTQHTIDAHLAQCKPADCILPYLDKAFKCTTEQEDTVLFRKDWHLEM